MEDGAGEFNVPSDLKTTSLSLSPLSNLVIILGSMLGKSRNLEYNTVEYEVWQSGISGSDTFSASGLSTHPLLLGSCSLPHSNHSVSVEAANHSAIQRRYYLFLLGTWL